MTFPRLSSSANSSSSSVFNYVVLGVFAKRDWPVLEGTLGFSVVEAEVVAIEAGNSVMHERGDPG